MKSTKWEQKTCSVKKNRFGRVGESVVEKTVLVFWFCPI